MKHPMCSKAVAVIRGEREYPQLKGSVKAYGRNDGVIIEAELYGLPKTEAGFFGFHIHEGSSCAGDGFHFTGGHFDITGKPHPEHSGDLPPLLAEDGRAYMKVFTARVRLGDIIGRTVIIHSGPDDFYSQPSGNSGKKIACGVFRMI